MKKLIVTAFCLGLVLPALAIDRSELDYRLRKLAIKLDSMQAKADKRIPADKLKQAKGIIMLDRTKAGFVFAFQGGSGVAMVRAKGSGAWSAPAFLTASEASLGFQIGGQQSFVVILLMNTNSISMITEGNFNFGGEASGTAGSASAKAEGTVSEPEPLVMVFDDKHGLYGGAAIKGDSITPDTDANIAYYGQYLATREILLEGKGKATEAATELAKKIDQYSSSK